jgi:hypothetical protein
MHRITFAAGAIFLVVIASIVFIGSSKDEIVKNNNLDPATFSPLEDREYWLSELQAVGAEKTYEAFVEENGKTIESLRHLRAHLIGEALYEHEGVEGIAYCDSAFGFGCFHGFYGAGFSSEGISFVEKADESCVERFGYLGTGCQHGIGHGILEYFGHSKLREALEACGSTTEMVPLLGCSSGIFMEYNTPLVVLPGVENLGPKPFIEDSPYGPCEDVQDKYKPSCYYELGPWWMQVLDNDWVQMGEMCARVKNISLRSACAMGIGNGISPSVGFNVTKAKEACNLVPNKVRVMCLSGVSWSLFSNPDYEDSSDSVCADLGEQEQRTCLGTRDLAHPKGS